MQQRASSIMPSDDPQTLDNQPAATPTRRKAPLIGVIGAAVLSLALVGWIGMRVVSATGKQQAISQQRSADAEKSAALAKAPPKVRVTAPISETWVPVVELDGTLNAEQRAELGFKVGGRLAKVGVKVGDLVKSGALLGILDGSEAGAQLRAAEAQLRAAEAQLALADDAERRTASMVKSGSFAEASGVQSAQQRALAQAQADSAKAQAGLVQVSLGNHRLVAPFSGTITRAPEGIGSVVAPGAVLFEINDLSRLKLKGTLSESDAALVSVGSKVQITSEQGSVTGVLTIVLGAVDPATRRVRVEATVDNTREPRLRAGSFVRGKIAAGDPIPVLKLPHDTQRPGTQDEVLVVEGDKLAVRRVTYAIAADGSLLVRSGLKGDERVVLGPKPEQEPGQVVSIEDAGSKP
jgi:membrane fusion protein, multidrug efflux system